MHIYISGDWDIFFQKSNLLASFSYWTLSLGLAEFLLWVGACFAVAVVSFHSRFIIIWAGGWR